MKIYFISVHGRWWLSVYCSVVKNGTVDHPGCRGNAVQGARHNSDWSLLCIWCFHSSEREFLISLTVVMPPPTVKGQSSSRMRVIYHNWSAMKQCPHPQSVTEISHHSVLSGGRIRQCETRFLLKTKEKIFSQMQTKCSSIFWLQPSISCSFHIAIHSQIWHGVYTLMPCYTLTPGPVESAY